MNVMQRPVNEAPRAGSRTGGVHGREVQLAAGMWYETEAPPSACADKPFHFFHFIAKADP